MEKAIFQNYPLEERKQMLEDNADEITEMSYTKKFHSAERNIRRARNSEIDLILEGLDEEMKSLKENIKSRRKPLEEEKKKILDELRSDGEFIRGKVYKMVDIDERMVYFYDEEGNRIDSRRMTNSDRQIAMKFNNAKTGTND